MGGIIALLGLLVMLVGVIMILIAAFKESILWGVLSLLVPFAILVFVAMHWSASKKGFLIWLGGFVLAVIGSVLGGSAATYSAGLLLL